jgi:hypothetical protein
MNRDFGIAVSLALGLALLSVAPAAAELAPGDLINLVPSNGIVANIMAPGASPKIAEVTEKLQRVAAEDPKWWQDYVKDIPPGTPIPYHPKMEITKEEYLDFIHLASEPTLIKYGELIISVQTVEDGIYEISAGDSVPEMNGIRIDLLQDRITTPYGQATKRTIVARNPESQKMTGTWEGVQWEHLEMDTTAMKGTSIHFALGKLDESGEAILYYRVFKVNADQPPTDVMVVLNYAVREEQKPSTSP